MTNSENTKAIKAKIRALAAKTVDNGCTEAEALAAMQMVGKLLSQYNLSMSEVEMSAEEMILKTIRTGSKHSGGVYWAVYGIGMITNTKPFIQRNSSEITYNFFGQETDVLMAEYLYRLIDGSINREVVTFKKTEIYKRATSARGASSSFIKAMGMRLGHRLIQMAREEEVQMNSSGGRELMIIKGQLVTQEFAKLNYNLTSKKGNADIKNQSAANAGYNAANSVNLSSKPVGQNSSSTLMIGRG
jgi:hypothetical protein